jgi:hypothetical protein
VCVAACDLEGADCTFTCRVEPSVDDTAVCVPDAGDCSIDRDGDGFGTGAGCAGADCDDGDLARSLNAPERCNGVDDDCNSVVDKEAVDCITARCTAAKPRSSALDASPSSPVRTGTPRALPRRRPSYGLVSPPAG